MKTGFTVGTRGSTNLTKRARLTFKTVRVALFRLLSARNFNVCRACAWLSFASSRVGIGSPFPQNVMPTRTGSIVSAGVARKFRCHRCTRLRLLRGRENLADQPSSTNFPFYGLVTVERRRRSHGVKLLTRSLSGNYFVLLFVFFLLVHNQTIEYNH